MTLSASEMFMKMAIDKLLEHLPPETIQNIKQIAETIAGFKAQLNDIQDRIITLETQFAIIYGTRFLRETGKGINETDTAGEQSET